MKKFKKLLMVSLVGMMMCSAPAMTADAAWKTTSEGKMYTQTASPGYVTGLKKIGSYYYYFNSEGIMQTGFQTINGKTYYFRKTNGRRLTGWLSVSSNGTKYRYYFNENGVMQTGLQTIDEKMYYFSSKGIMQKGWIRTSKGTYYADKTTGALLTSTWLNDTYYFQEDGIMATSTWINGKWVGADGKYTGIQMKVGWITENGKTYYYSKSGKMIKGWMTLSGKTYYLNASTGVLQKGWFSVGGKTYYASKNQGIVCKKKWISGKYLKSNGVMATGLTTISGKTYYFNSSGVKQTGWQTISKKTYYFDSDGVMQKSTWIEDRYVNSKGIMVTGWQTLGKKTYYFNTSTGIKVTGWLTLDGSKYYLSKSTGALQKSKWLLSQKYYAGTNGAILKGLNAISGSLYYFDPTTGVKLTKSLKTISSATYYFMADGAAAKSMWVKISSKYYYFQSTGKMAKNMWIGNYYVNENGVRSDATNLRGWQLINGKKYYFDDSGKKVTGWKTLDGKKYYFKSSGVMTTGFKTIDGSKYYFDEDGVMVTGLQTIGSKKYYFYSDGTMAVSLTIAVGTKQYTINSNGVVTKETSIKIDGTSTGAKIVNFALQYVGNPYVYGGTSLTNGADCSGFVQTVFSQFGYKLLRVANDQMYGPTSSYISNYGYTAAVVVDMNSLQPGDLLFYGSGNYASHVAIYMGDGQIVHASNSQPYPKGGIKISNYDYQTPIKAVRYWS